MPRSSLSCTITRLAFSGVPNTPWMKSKPMRAPSTVLPRTSTVVPDRSSVSSAVLTFS